MQKKRGFVSPNSEELRETYPRMSNLFGANFTEDWVADYGDSPKAAIDDFKSSLESAKLQGAIAEIDALFSRFNDSQLIDVLDRLGNCYYYENDGFGARGWLEQVRSELAFDPI